MTRNFPARGCCTLSEADPTSDRDLEVLAREDLVLDVVRCSLCGVRLPRAEDGVDVGRAVACAACAQRYFAALQIGTEAEKAHR